MNKLVPWYQANMRKTVKLGRFMVTVTKHTSNNRYGSWGRGFKFSDVAYGVLTRKATSLAGQRLSWSSGSKRTVYSMDHGVSWHLALKEARKSKGKIRLDTYKSTEFAFEAIQEINRKWDGPGYKWRP